MIPVEHFSHDQLFQSGFPPHGSAQSQLTEIQLMDSHATMITNMRPQPYSMHFLLQQAPAMSSLQMLRLALESLTQPWGLSKGLALAHASPPILGMPVNSPPLKTFKRHCAVVLVGPSGWLNVASSVSSASMRQVRAVFSPVLDPIMLFIGFCLAGIVPSPLCCCAMSDVAAYTIFSGTAPSRLV